MGQIRIYQQAINRNAIKHGWWEEERTFPELLCLIHSEISECLEYFREGLKPQEHFYKNGKPVDIPSELADIVIRVFDLAEHYNIDMENEIKRKHYYNKSRPFKHGGKIL